ncbi:MAG: hypothetical protein ACK8QZ_04285 [Anaerolineales bacterium]
MRYKRSQLEDAICKANRAERGAVRTKLLARIKRLLDVDRTLASKRGANLRQRLAFFSEERRGTGQEASFAEYEIFALDVALRLAMHGIQQTDIVEILRQLRPQLEVRHRKLLANRFDFEMPQPVVRISDHRVFLSVSAADSSAPYKTDNGFTAALLEGGTEWWNHVFSQTGKAATIVEITFIPAELRELLHAIKPRKKGRPS